MHTHVFVGSSLHDATLRGPWRWRKAYSLCARDGKVRVQNVADSPDRQTDRQTDRPDSQTGREVGRQACRHPDRQTHRQTDRQAER